MVELVVPELAQIVERLEEEIVFGRLRPRERLVEEYLVMQFGTKKHVVRQALSELERMGLVVRERNRGAKVRDYTPSEVKQIFEVRKLLEAEAARQIPFPVADDTLKRLRRLQADHSDAVEAGDLPTAFRSNIAFHQTLFVACENSYLAEAIELFALKAHAVRSYTLTNPKLLLRARDEHRQIIEALEKADRERLVTLCIAHLKPSVEAYIAAYERILDPQFARSA